MKKNAPDRKAPIEGRKYSNGKSTTDLSTEAQRQRLLDALTERGSITTQQARDELEVMHPAGRIMELRKKGVEIVTVWAHEQSAGGVVHRIARYLMRRAA